MKIQAMIQRKITILILAAPLLVRLSDPLAGQSFGRMWAAQTGQNQVTLSWDPIPGTVEYRIYLGAPGGPSATVERQPEIRLSGNSRGAILTGVQRLSNGIYMVATDAGGQVLQQAQFNPLSTATGLDPLVPPTQVKATATGATEVALSWSPVPGATAYFIGRSVGGSGFSTLCSLCSTDTQYVDRSAVPGLRHSYSISAIFPNGLSRRTASNQVIPGATQVAATTTPQPTVSTQTPSAATLPANNSPGGVSGAVSSGAAPFTPGGTPAGTAPIQTPNYTPPGVSGASSTGTTSFTPAGTPVAATQPAVVTQGTPITTTLTTTNQIGVAYELAGRMREMLANMATSVGAATAATIGQVQGMANSIADALSTHMMQASTTTHTATPVTTTSTTTTSTANNPFGGMLGGQAGSLASQLGQLATPTGIAPQTTTVHTATPVTPPPTTTASTANNPFAGMPGGLAGFLANQPDPVSTPAAITTQTAPVHAATPIASPCKLDYQRADTMWAALGRPDGQLGTETISLLAGQNREFITDWKYEHTRNNGANFYGSHLRLATNSGSGTIRMLVRALDFTGLELTMTPLWTTMPPGSTKQFRADLMQVSCEK